MGDGGAAARVGVNRSAAGKGSPPPPHRLHVAPVRVVCLHLHDPRFRIVMGLDLNLDRAALVVAARDPLEVVHPGERGGVELARDAVAIFVLLFLSVETSSILLHLLRIEDGGEDESPIPKHKLKT